MAPGTRHRRSSKGKAKEKTKAKQSRPAAAATTVHDIPDHVLTLILLQLDSSATLLRAAAACKLWCRIIVDAGFLTRFRALHAPCVAGHYHAFDPDWVEYGSPPITGTPVFLPSSSPCNIVHSRHFALDFLPESDSGWAILDSCGGLLLLYQRRGSYDLVVCDPLTRRYQGILGGGGGPGVFLLDGDDHHARTSVSNFRVITVDVVDYEYLESEPNEGHYGPAVGLFRPDNDDGGWEDLPTTATNSDGITLPGSSITFVGRVNGALYWITGEDGFLLVLDEATISFSRITFPAGSAVATGCCDKWSFRVIGGEDGALRVVRTISSNLTIFKRQQGSDDDEWVVQRFLPLRDAPVDLPGRDVDYWYFYRNAMIVAAHDTYVLITPQEKTCLFSVELDTMQVEQDKERNKYPGPAYPCELPWPPALEACTAALDHPRRRRGRTSFY